ncbi:organic cation transporter protein-like [Patiria miniata]|uniref:Major facilitator superfamily (MFS) profile domain-containing protein n=1 Tax=Patiria miniata TaxID=46514 RepID=A0A913Z065_PATMI|nr:organic cation transporter protein-like [Patiria miniata]
MTEDQKDDLKIDSGENEPPKFDDILEIIGGFGKWQKILFVWAPLIGVMTGAHTIAQVFFAGESDHWCRVPKWDHANCTANGQPDDWGCLLAKRDASIPFQIQGGKKVYDSCKMYDVLNVDFTVGMNTSDYSNVTIKCPTAEAGSHAWEYDTRQYKTTIITEFDLVCDDRGTPSILQSVYFGGLLVGSLFFGSLADFIGRKPATYLASALLLLMSLGNIFSPSIVVYAILRFFVAAGAMGAFICVFVLVNEFLSPNRRVLVGISFQGFFAAGLTIVPLLAYFIRYWRFLQLCIALPTALYILMYFQMPESARWQITKGRYSQAEKTLRQVAARNKKDFPEEMFSPEAISAAQETQSKGQSTAVGLFRTPNMRIKTLNIMFNWFVNSMVYYGLNLSTSDLGVDDYLAAVISGLVEFPSYVFCVIALQYVGRRINLGGNLLVGGVACIITAFLDAGNARLAIAMIGKFCISASFAIIYVVSGEIYPTSVRSAGLGISSASARFAGILSPFILDLKEFWSPLPFVVFGSLSVAAGLLSFLLPETKDKKLPETLEEGEAFGKCKCLGYNKEDDAFPTMAIIDMTELDTKQEVHNYAFDNKESKPKDTDEK